MQCSAVQCARLQLPAPSFKSLVVRYRIVILFFLSLRRGHHTRWLYSELFRSSRFLRLDRTVYISVVVVMVVPFLLQVASGDRPNCMGSGLVSCPAHQVPFLVVLRRIFKGTRKRRRGRLRCYHKRVFFLSTFFFFHGRVHGTWTIERGLHRVLIVVFGRRDYFATLLLSMFTNRFLIFFFFFFFFFCLQVCRLTWDFERRVEIVSTAGGMRRWWDPSAGRSSWLRRRSQWFFFFFSSWPSNSVKVKVITTATTLIISFHYPQSDKSFNYGDEREGIFIASSFCGKYKSTRFSSLSPTTSLW